MIQLTLTSTSSIKRKSVEFLISYLKARGYTNVSLRCINPGDSNDQVPQPIGEENGIFACRNRIQSVLSVLANLTEIPAEMPTMPTAMSAEMPTMPTDSSVTMDKKKDAKDGTHYIISIENYIDNKSGKQYDQAVIIIYDVGKKQEWLRISDGVELPDSPDSPIMTKLLANFPHSRGASKTYGSLYALMYPEVAADNWVTVKGLDRTNLLGNGLTILWQSQVQPELDLCRDVWAKFQFYKDFPKPGVTFMDWSDLFLDASLLHQLIKFIARRYQNIDYVIGLESRGYFIAVPLATELKAGFLPMRKAGKTPGKVVSKAYKKEYGEDVVELRADLKPGRCLIVDDVLATGGSLRAAADLAREVGHTVVDTIVITDVPVLREIASSKLKGVPVRVII